MKRWAYSPPDRYPKSSQVFQQFFCNAGLHRLTGYKRADHLPPFVQRREINRHQAIAGVMRMKKAFDLAPLRARAQVWDKAFLTLRY